MSESWAWAVASAGTRARLGFCSPWGPGGEAGATRDPHVSPSKVTKVTVGAEPVSLASHHVHGFLFCLPRYLMRAF